MCYLWLGLCWQQCESDRESWRVGCWFGGCNVCSAVEAEGLCTTAETNLSPALSRSASGSAETTNNVLQDDDDDDDVFSQTFIMSRKPHIH